MLIDLVDAEGNVTGTMERDTDLAVVVDIFQRPDVVGSLTNVQVAKKNLDDCAKLVRADRNLLEESLAAQGRAKNVLQVAVYDLLRALGVE